MALTKVRPPRDPGAPAGRDADTRRHPLASPWVLIGSIAAALLLFGGVFLLHPTLSPPTRDPAWYTWRAELLSHSSPAAIIKEWGPYGMFSGGYRVTTPILGAWLIEVAGVSRFTFSILVMVAAPALISLALGAFAWRHRRDPLLFLLTFFATAVMFLTTPYVGYMDNIVGLYILALTLPFIQAARTSWGARSAIAILMFLATMTHPTTTAIFVAVLLAGAGLHFLTSRLSIVRTLRSDGWLLTSAGVGTVVGLAMWKIGVWGVKAPFADAALPPPYPASEFKSGLGQWFLSLQPAFTGPLIAIALGAIAATAWRRRRDGEPMDEYPRMSLLWLLPYLGVFGFVLGFSYPYYRFMNTTLAVILLTGMGAWLLARFLLKRWAVAGIAVIALIFVGYGWIAFFGLQNWTKDSPSSRFLNPESRVALASVTAYVGAADPDRPVVFIANYRHESKSWGWAKTYSNTARSGLSGDQADRSQIFFGDVRDYFAGRPSASGITFKQCDEDGVPYDKVYECVSLGFFHEMTLGLKPFAKDPTVFLVTRFNQGTPNIAALKRAPAKLGPDVAVLSGPHAAPVDQRALQAGVRAGQLEQARLDDPPSRFADPLGVLRVLFFVGIALVVPGLLAARWFELEDFPTRLALVPGLSIALLLVSSIAVLAATRSAFGFASGVAALVLAIALGFVLRLLARRRERGKQVIVPFVERSLSLFQNRDFGTLMGAVFLAVLGDGIVQGALAKTIAFGGKKGFDLSTGRSARDILALLLLTYLPYTFVSPFLGVLIDRFDRRVLLMIANGARAVVVALVGIALLAAGSLANPILIAALLLTLASTRLVLAIKSAGIPGVLEGKNLVQGNSISQAGQAVCQLVGAGIALVGTTIVSAGVVVAAGGIVYGVGAGFASRTRNLSERARTLSLGESAKRILRNLAAGLREVRSRAGAKLALFSFLALRVLFAYVLIVFALEARKLFGAKSDKLALLVPALAGALGAGIGFVLAQLLKDRVPPARLLSAAMLFMGGSVLAFGGIVSVLGLSLIAFAAALTYFVGKVSADTLTQQAVSDDFRGRAFSLFDVAYNIAWIIPALVLFAVWAENGSRAGLLLVIAGVVFVLAALATFAWARKLGLDSRRPRSRSESRA